MFDVYIKNFNNSSGTLVTTEKKVFTIPSNRVDGYQFIGPTVKSSEDNADSFDFTMEQCSPLYNSLLQLKTLLRVVYDGTTIFNGRVLTISNSTVYQTKRVHCEGAYGYMNDSNYPGVKEKSRSKISWSTYLDRIISNHNSQVAGQNDNPEKYIYRGNVTVDGSTAFTPTTEQRKYEPDSWTQTLSLIGNLKSEFGGHFRVRHNDSNGRNYLDWYKYYLRDLGANRPTVEVGVNIIDFNTDTNVDNIFTRVIPTGQASGGSGDPIYVDGYVYTDKNGTQHTHSGKAIPVSLIRSLYSDSQLNDDFHSASDYSSAETNYGVIYKVQNFAGAKTKEQLWNYTKKWMKECYFGLATSFDIKAVDMHIVDQTKQKILIGDCVNIRYYITENGQRVRKTKRYVCKAITYDLFNPENNTYTFGIPSEILNRTYSEGKKGKASDEAPKGGGGGPGGEEDFTVTFENIRLSILADESEYGGEVRAEYFAEHGEMNGSCRCYDPETIGGDPNEHKDKWFDVHIVGRVAANVYVGTSEYGVCAIVGSSLYKTGTAYAVAHWYTRRKAIFVPSTPVVDEGVRENAKIISVLSGLTVDEVIDRVNKISIKVTNNLSSVEWWQNTIHGAQETAQKLSQMNFTEALGAIFGLNNNSETPTVELKGEDGKVELSDSKGNTNIDLSGEDAKVEVENPTTGRPATVIDGKNKFIKMDKDPNGNWLLQLNVPITYVDQDGHTVTTDNAIKASDFNIPSIPSFKTKLAVIDNLVAARATIGQLNSAEARINNLIAGCIKTDELYGQIAALERVSVRLLSSERGGINVYNVATTGFSQGDVSCYVPDAINAVQVVRGSTSGTYQLQFKRFRSDSWQNAGDPFEMAGGIESVSWGWSAGSAKAVIRLQGGGREEYLSPSLDYIQKNGDPIWDEDKKKFRQSFTIYDENHFDVYTDEAIGKFDATEAWNAGYAKGSPSSGQALARSGSSYDWTFKITRADRTTKNLTIDASSIYSDARQGYTMGNFSLASVTLQGALHTIKPIVSSSAIRTNGTALSLKRPGTTTKYDRGKSFKGFKKLSSGGTLYYKAKTKTTYYKGNGGTKTAIGSPRYWKRHTTSSDPPTGTYWYSMHTSNPGGTVVTNYYAGSSFEARGETVDVTEINSGSAIRLDTERALYPGDGGSFKVEGTDITAYEKLSTGGNLYYTLGDTLYLYDAGETVTNTYYTKS